MDTLPRGPLVTVPTPRPVVPLSWTKVGTTEVRPDGSSVERFTSNQGGTRELLRVLPPPVSVLLFAPTSIRAFQGSTMPPVREREVHAHYTSLLARDPNRVTMWKEDTEGTIIEMPLSHNPVLGPPKHRVIERFIKGTAEPKENPEWTRLHQALTTPF